MSTRYPGDTKDVLFMNDGNPFWASPDLWVNTANGTIATEGPNTVFARASMTPGGTFEGTQAQVQVFVGNPSLVMTPSAGTVPVGSALIPKADLAAGPVTKQLAWTVTVDPANPGGPDQPGHRCLIARVFPFGTSAPTDFDVPNDKHEAQRNISILKAAKVGSPFGGAGGGMAGAPKGEPIGPGEDGLWEFRVDTTVPLGVKPAPVLITAGAPEKVPDGLLKAVAEALDVPFEGFAKPAEKFLLDFDLPDKDLPRNPGRRPWRPKVGRPTFDDRVSRMRVEVGLEPEHVARFGLKVDLSDTPAGQAQVFDLEQTAADGRRQGGLTVILHRVE